MRHIVALIVAAGCGSEGSFQDLDKNGPRDPDKDSTPETNTEDTTETSTTNTGTTGTTTTETTTTETSSTYPTVDPVTPDPPAPCPYVFDTTALADCTAGGYAALYLGIGYADIQSALDASTSGSTVTVCPGTWPGGLSLGDNLTLTAADPTFGATIIDAAGASRVIDSLNATLIGLTLTNGAADSAPGIYDTGTLLLECMAVTNNQTVGGYYGYGGYYYATGEGGGAVADSITVRYSTFSANQAGSGGGAISAQDAVIEDSLFIDNRAGYEGGALSVPVLEVYRSEFINNRSGYEAGAISAGGAFSPGLLTIEDSVFEGNEADYEGGAIEIGAWETDPSVIVRSRFTANTALYGGSAIGLGTWGGVDLTVSECTFEDNFGADAPIAAGGWVEDGGTITLSGSVFEDNQGGTSGFLSTDATGSATIDVIGTDLSILRNDGGGGALYLRGIDTFDCTNCDFGTGADDNTPRDATQGGTNVATLPLTFVM